MDFTVQLMLPAYHVIHFRCVRFASCMMFCPFDQIAASYLWKRPAPDQPGWPGTLASTRNDQPPIGLTFGSIRPA